MRKKGAKGAPTAANFRRAKQTAKLNDKTMSKRKSSSERKFAVYPGIYYAYASKICAGKIKDPSGVKEKILKVENLQWVEELN